MSPAGTAGALATAAKRLAALASRECPQRRRALSFTSGRRSLALDRGPAADADARFIIGVTAGVLLVCSAKQDCSFAEARPADLRFQTSDNHKIAKWEPPDSDVSTQRALNFLKHQRSPLQFEHGGQYDKMHRIGKGSSGEVFEGVRHGTNDKCAIKKLKTTKSNNGRLEREVKILTKLHGGPNIIQLLDVVEDAEAETPCLVFEHVDNTSHKKLYPILGDDDIRHYMFELLKAVDYCHSQGVMHRDVKPRNVVIDHSQKTLRLIDFGLAEFYHPGQDYSVKVSSLYYKPPELLLGLKRYDCSLDVWSLGCMLAGLVFRKEPFFRGQHDQDQLVKIAAVLGTDDLYAFLQKYKRVLDRSLALELPDFGRIPKMSWTNFLTEEQAPETGYSKISVWRRGCQENSHTVSLEAIDLIKRMLVYDPAQRISVKEAMAHPYFASVRDRKADEYVKLSFEPGPLGVSAQPDGYVLKVYKGGQGDHLGVLPGWRIDQINGVKFSVSELKGHVRGQYGQQQSYSILFKKAEAQDV